MLSPKQKPATHRPQQAFKKTADPFSADDTESFYAKAARLEAEIQIMINQGFSPIMIDGLIAKQMSFGQRPAATPRPAIAWRRNILQSRLIRRTRQRQCARAAFNQNCFDVFSPSALVQTSLQQGAETIVQLFCTLATPLQQLQKTKDYCFKKARAVLTLCL